MVSGDTVQSLSPPIDGMTMDIGLHRFELTGFGKLAGLGGTFPPQQKTAEYVRRGLIWLPVILIAGLGAWLLLLLSGEASHTAVSEPANGPVRLAAAVVSEPLEFTRTNAGAPLDLLPAPAQEGAVSAQMAPVDGLKIASQSWRRGGLGSKALVTFTLRNANEFAVKDIEILCSFTRRDGSPLTERRRTIPDVVKMKSRKTFARMHVGFVNVNADRAKCSPVTASRV